jgi:hypothetical protein
LVTLAAGCPDDDDGAGADTGSASGSVVAACDVPDSCGRILLQCLAGDAASCADVTIGVPMRCALTKLADGEPAYLDYQFNGLLNGEVEWYEIAIAGDGTLVRQHGAEDPGTLDIIYDSPERCSMRPAAWYQACLDGNVDEQTHADCMDARRWVEDDCVTTSGCP